MDLFRNEYATAISWFTAHGFKIAGIILGAFLIYKFGDAFIEKIIRKAIVPRKFVTKEEEKKREDTLIQVLSTALNILIVVLALLMILSEIGINTTPLIASAGIVGIAVGFGGQYLIKDFISGTFIILENQYRVGDVVCLGTTCGLVEDMNLRITVLRDLDGIVHHVPNGEIKISSNYSKDHANVNLNIGIAYDTSLEKVIQIINKVGNDLSEDKDWKEKIRKPPQFLRVDDFADSAVIVKILGETAPLKQWEVAGELRKRIKIAFDKEHIEIPFPQRVVHMKNIG
ncbi:mechanosensitive ion channel family protein [Patescibacteria group bacterium]|nr:mechanosensitive ion channel family protein [Patescibacteria group bacterium]